MKIYLFGHRGYVGGWIYESFQRKGFEMVPCDVNVVHREEVEKALEGTSNALVINATGKTGKPNVDWCEDHRKETVDVNIVGALNVAEVARAKGHYVLQIGSGCIFDGYEHQAFTEDDEPNFFGSFYSQTKAVVEGALKEIPEVCVLRIRMPLEGRVHPKNLFTKLLGYQRILNLPNSVTIMEDLMEFIEKVVKKRPSGVLNAVNPGVYRHEDLLERFREKVDPDRSFEYIGAEAFEGMTKAARSNCVLSAALTESMGIAMPPVHERLDDVVESYRQSLLESSS